MKETLLKFFGLFAEGVNKLEEKKEAEALEKLTEASKLSKDITKTLENFEEKEDLTKTLVKEEIKKYADLFLSGKDLQELLEQIKTATSTIEELQKKVEELEKEKNENDEVIEKTLNAHEEALAKINETLVSKQS